MAERGARLQTGLKQVRARHIGPKQGCVQPYGKPHGHRIAKETLRDSPVNHTSLIGRRP
ncbi:MAG: hypothetical protein BWY92_01207 [Firmicutes bacterium ADurb.BinA052]|jgi:hypothetical protein|nr:MAG: hypothetical protein BWY92_01207 [Firmicutes bacterium ADurb.BinA052]